VKIMITGGAGFIGSNFVRYVLNKYPGDRVVNYDKLTYAGNPDNLIGLDESPNYRFIQGDIDDLSEVTRAMEGCSTVVNFAAESHVDRSIESGRDFMETNVLGTQTMLEAARSLGVSRFLHVSTDEVYGSIDSGSFLETDRLEPSSPYSASKAAADLVCHSYRTTYDMPIIITRSSNNFGPYQYPEKLIPLLITNALEDRALPIYGDGLNVRDWIYVEDNCAGIDTALRAGKPGEVYNIGGGNEIENLKIARTVLEALGKPESLISFVADRLGHDRRYSINCDKLRALGWTPQYRFDVALKKTVEWYEENRPWWRKLQEKDSQELEVRS
jgi:dTDP-glucose 4,6-dehydratase